MAGGIVFGFVCALGMAETEKSIVLDDFEAASAVSRWNPSQDARVRVEAVEPEDDLATGHALILDAPKSGIVATGARSVPANWSEFEQLEFRARRMGGTEPLNLELWLLEADKKTKFWHKFTVESDEWVRFDLPIRYFRWGDGRIPDSTQIDRIAFFARDAGSIAIDDIVLRDDPAGPGTRIPMAELAEIAFPSGSGPRVVSRDRLELASDCDELDLERLADRLEGVIARVCAECGLEISENRPPQMLVFAEESRYRSFPATLAAKFDAACDPPESAGFTFMGIATSFYDPAKGVDRPVFTHEIVHSVLSNAGALDNSNEWLQEGIATWIQLQFHPQVDWGDIVSRGLDDKRFRLPLEKLLDGKRIPDNRYWQAATVVDYLVHGTGRFRPLLAAMVKSGSTAIEPQLGTVLETDFAKLTSNWQTWCREYHAK